MCHRHHSEVYRHSWNIPALSYYSGKASGLLTMAGHDGCDFGRFSLSLSHLLIQIPASPWNCYRLPHQSRGSSMPLENTVLQKRWRKISAWASIVSCSLEDEWMTGWVQFSLWWEKEETPDPSRKAHVGGTSARVPTNHSHVLFIGRSVCVTLSRDVKNNKCFLPGSSHVTHPKEMLANQSFRRVR